MLTSDYFGVYLKSQNENASHNNWAVIGSLALNMRSDSLWAEKPTVFYGVDRKERESPRQ